MPRRSDHLQPPGKAVQVLHAEFGMFKIGASRFEFRASYHFAIGLPLPYFTLLILGSCLAINLAFAALYVIDPGGIANAPPRSFWHLFFFSIETLATVGYGVKAPVSTYAHIVSATESAVCMAFTAIVTRLLFGRFSQPQARITYAACPVITTFNDHRTLMVRLANSRLIEMINANALLFALISEQTSEGKFCRPLHKLSLLQSHPPLLILPWTLMHVMDAMRPLFGYSPESLAAADVRLFVTV